MLGNASYITKDNIVRLNEEAMRIFNLRTTTLSQSDVEILRQIIMICNVLYNRTDMNIQPVDDGFYDLLLELYKKYDSNFQVGSAVVDFQNFINNDIDHPNRKVAESPIVFFENPQRDSVHQMVYDKINPPVQINREDLMYYANNTWNPQQVLISKRLHNTKHNHPDLVGTLDKCKFVFNQDAIDAGVFDDPTVSILERDFFQKHVEKRLINPNDRIGIVCELKYDGVSVEADCTDHIISARTRGDTGIGQASDLTPLLAGYQFIHAGVLKDSKPIGVKFEAIMKKSTLYKYNERRNKGYVNSRAAVVGLISSSNPDNLQAYLTLVPLAIDRNDVPRISNRLEEIEFINTLFRSHGEPLRYCYFDGTLPEILYLIKAFYDEAIVARNYLDFMFDGIVVSYTDENLRAKLGRQNFINKYSMAVKFPALRKETIFIGYTYEVGQHGQITPMIHYNPVEFNGTIHTKSSGSSLKRFNDLALKVGDFISVEYRNDVMPYVSRLECSHNRENPNPIVPIIDRCPVCGSQLVVSESGKELLCINTECPGRAKQRMINMFQKLNIKGFADASISALNVKHLYELENMTEAQLISTLGQADGRAFYATIQSILNDEWQDYVVMASLGFTSMAYAKWKSVLEQISLQELYEMFMTSNCEEEFYSRLIESVNKLGEITARTIAKEFPFFKLDIEFILRRMHLRRVSIGNDNQIIIRLSGFRDQQLCQLLSTIGIDCSDSAVTKKTSLLIIPFEGFMSTKVQKAMQYGIPIVSKDEFYLRSKELIGLELMKF